MSYLATACQTTLVLVFLAAATGKVRGRTAFTEFARSTRTMLASAVPGWSVHRRVLRRVAGAVVATEFAVPAAVAVPGLARLGDAVAIALLAMFSGGIAAAVRRGVDASCHCFGGSSAPVGPQHLVRNAVLFAVAVGGLVAGPARLAGPNRGGLVVALAAAVVLAVLVVRLDDLVALFAPTPSADHGGPTRKA
jgi:hypothetical protein